MECVDCRYQMDSLDAVCPRCQTAQSQAPQSQNAQSRPPSSAAAKQAAAKTLPHSPEEKRRHLRENIWKFAAGGAAGALALSFVLGFFLHQFRIVALAAYWNRSDVGYAASLVMNIGAYPAVLLPTLVFMGLCGALGWLIGRQWQETAGSLSVQNALSSSARKINHNDAGLGAQAALLGLCFGLGAAFIFLVVEYIHSRILPHPQLVEWWIQNGHSGPRGNEYAIVLILRVFLTFAGLAIGGFYGRLVGLQEYEIARQRKFAVPRAAYRPNSGRRVPGVTQENNWPIFAFSFFLPCLGLLLWMSFSKTDEDKAASAGLGAVLGLILGSAIAVLRIILRQSATS